MNIVEIGRDKLYPITPDALKWSNLDTKANIGRRACVIGSIAGTIILLAAIVIASYYCTQATDTSTTISGEVITKSLGVLMIAPILGGGCLVCFPVSGVIVSVTWEKICYGKARQLSSNQAHNETVELLTQKGLEELFNTWDHRDGGLRTLIENGYITVEQANSLRALFKKFENNRAARNNYTGQTHTNKAIINKKYPCDYANAIDALHGLNKQWHLIQQQICQKYGVNAPPDPIKENDFERLAEPVLLELTKRARKWRNLSKEHKREELIAKISFAAGIALVAAALAVAIYFSSVTTYTYTNYLGQTIIRSNSYLSAIWTVGGLFGEGGLITGLCCCWNYESIQNRREEDLSKKHIREDRILLLTEGSLADIRSHYDKNHGGLGPLVRKGILTAGQAKGLLELFKGYHENQASKNAYINQDDRGLVELNRQGTELENSLKNIQREIKQSLKLYRDEEVVPQLEEVEEKKEEQKFPLMNLPTVVLQNILSNFSLNELAGMAPVSKKMNEQVQKAVVFRANTHFSAHTDHYNEARDWVQKISKNFSSTFFNGWVSKEILLGRAVVISTEKGDLEMIKQLVARKASLEFRDEQGRTPLHIAVQKGNVELVKFLIDNGADKGALDYSKNKPAFYTNREDLLSLFK